MCRSGTDIAARLVATVVGAAAFGITLAGCSDLYWDRRDAIAFSAGDAIAANAAEQIIDPWPPHSRNNNIAFNGERMQRAVECYRANKVTPPIDISNQTATSGSSSGSGNSSSGSASGSASGAACQGQMMNTVGATQPVGGPAPAGYAAK